MIGHLLLLACLLSLLGACNMVISETPLFSPEDEATFRPRDGVWVVDDPDCKFDSSLPESDWPKCAMWIVARPNGEVLLQNGEDEGQPGRFVIAKGQPPIVQILWRDEAKEDGKTFYVFFGLEAGRAQTDGAFVTAFSWDVMCGVKDPSSSEIEPYPGITPECRPSSKDSIRSAALASRANAEMAMHWRWLRPEAR